MTKPFKTTPQYWQCKCSNLSVHPRSLAVCTYCHAMRENQPHALVYKVLDMGYEIDGDGSIGEVILANYFHDLRFSPAHHLGLGDIRLTVAMQDDIVAKQNDSHKDFLSRLREANIALQHEKSRSKYLGELLQEVLNYHAGRGQFDVSRMSDEGQVLGEMLEGLLEEIKEAIS